MKLTFSESRIDMDGGCWLCLKVNETAPARAFVLRQNGKICDLEITAHQEKRSLNANAYCWVLIEKLAKAVQIPKNDLYLSYVRKVGPYKDFTLTEDEAGTFRVVWEKLGTGWPTEQVDYSPDGVRVVIRAYYGSSTYTTKQMSRLIDFIVEDCKAVGIETLPPDRLAAMKEGWSRASTD